VRQEQQPEKSRTEMEHCFLMRNKITGAGGGGGGE